MIVIILTLIGALLRFYNLNWDNGNFFHPDERNIAMAVSRIHFFDNLNPGFFAYGGFSIYLYRIIGEILLLITHNSAWIYDWGHINLIGRFCSAFFSTLTIPAVYFLTKNVFNKQTALISSLLTTFTVSFIQTAHFGVTESLITLLAVLLCLLSLYLFLYQKTKLYILTGIFLGIAVATKTSALLYIIFPLTAYISTLFTNRSNLFKKSLLLFTCFLIASITFFIFSPYTFLDWNKFMESMNYESGVATGKLPVVYTLQFTNTIPYVFQIQNFFWQMGSVALFSIVAPLFLLFVAIKQKKYTYIIFLSFPLVYFLYVGSWHTKFIRYMLPLLPFLIISGSFFLVTLSKKIKILGNFLLYAVCITTVLWALAFIHIYQKEQTRVTASTWIYTNILPQSKILTEHWDDGLPIQLKDFSPGMYTTKQLTIYEPDNAEKIQYYANTLSDADYIFINSRRLYGTLMHLPDKYPVTSKYYKLLFSEKLGYKKVAEFSSYPSLLGFDINDDASEETFQVYDHPKAIIFKNTGHFSEEKLKDILK